jgi:predicted phosphoadenosine phosphosulfate sulfurtransferase
MARYKKYVDQNVYDAAVDRINHVFDTFDTIVVMFSGGKDSLAVLHMVKEISEQRGINKVNVVFRDEELIPDVVIDFVDKYRQMDWVDMMYFAVPLHSQKFVLGNTEGYIQWDPSRKHIRPIPEHAITYDDGKVYDQYSMDALTASFYKGKIAFITGVRAAESLVRFRASVNKLNENYINAPTQNIGNVKMVKPLYDWEENDIFKYFYEKEIEYCKVYDRQLWNGDQFRVATPIHQEAAKKFNKLRTLDPMLYSQVIDLFPEMLVQERYWKELDRGTAKEEYSKSMDTIFDWIQINITENKQKKLAYKRFKEAYGLNKNYPEAYPLPHIFSYFETGGYKRSLMPNRSKK